jgi:DNA-binding beta-propeller fold protein YncE
LKALAAQILTGLKRKFGMKNPPTEGAMKKQSIILLTVFVLFALKAQCQAVQPLKLIQSIPIPGFHDGDFDHFATDPEDHLLFLAGEENGAVPVFDLNTNKLVHTITGLKAPHSMVYRADIKKLFVVDGDAAEVKIYETDTYKPVGSIKLQDDADSSAYDPATKYMYVVNGGEGAKMKYTLISIIDTTAGKKIGDIKVDAESVEALALEKSGPRMYANLESNNAVAVIDREKRTVIATWSIEKDAKRNGPLAFDEADKRVFVVAEDTGNIIVMDAESGKIINKMSCIGNTDDAVWDPQNRRVYVAGVPYIYIYNLIGNHRFRQIGQIPTSFHAVTGILVPRLNRYYLAVNHHGNTPAEVLVYEVMP